MAADDQLLKPLIDDQLKAADPAIHASLSASAGAGKTQVLTARVLRLLLGGVAPEAILCLTFTKAGAAEMANRIGERLAIWVRLPDSQLKAELFNLGEKVEPMKLDRARRLFAAVLDAPGGLRIQTIHSFAQSLLTAFPAEAGIAPGFEPIEGRAEQELARRTLADLAAEAEASGDGQLLSDIQVLALRLGEQAAEAYLLTCARHADALHAMGPREAIEPRLRDVVGLPPGDVEQAIQSELSDGKFDRLLFERLLRANRAWGSGKKATAIVTNLERFLASGPVDRAAMLEEVGQHIVRADGSNEPCAAASGQLRAEPDYALHAQRFAEWRARLLGWRAASELVAVQAAGLRAGQAYAAAYTRAKRSAGVADFDDLIRWTRNLLDTPGMGDWVRFKLDRRTDHILVDEAQDTNDDQWAIIDRLAEEYFSGSSESERRWRTLFMVGDFKQAIYSFQGTDPRSFEEMRRRIAVRAAGLGESAREDPDQPVRAYRDLSISRSFRSSPVILSLVDAVLARQGPAALGLPASPVAHTAYFKDLPGSVEWWPALDLDEEQAGMDLGEEGWLDEAEREHARRIARHVSALIQSGEAEPGDVMVLMRSRGELASLIVARLVAEGIPVAGIDRLHLQRPLAVKDILAALIFAAQPLDDLNLANLLTSPLVGWSIEQLETIAARRTGRLWDSLLDHESGSAPAAEALKILRPLLAMADFVTPSRMIETILSGTMQGRRKLLARLGPGARDPIEEIVTAALEFERQEVPSLDHFLAWFASGDVEIKRDPGASPGAVRVMTVHAAKGLEAPVVILADSTADPDRLGPSNPPLVHDIGSGAVPLIRPRKAERCSPFDERMGEEDARDSEEHLRLLYVALTRAQNTLVVTGVRKMGDPSNSWHAVVREAMVDIGAEQGEDGVLRSTFAGRPKRRERVPAADDEPVLPAWLSQAAPPEARPPRPLAPSAMVGDDVPYPPPRPGELDAARRGTLLHALFERLPETDPRRRREIALDWLERTARIPDASLREEMVVHALATIDDPRLADLFGPGSLAEAPIAAALPDGRVIAGTVDRLLVGEHEVRLVDFKTGTRVPQGPASVPSAHRAQMEAYGEALRAIFPGRKVVAALLYTAGPKIIELDG